MRVSRHTALTRLVCTEVCLRGRDSAHDRLLCLMEHMGNRGIVASDACMLDSGEESTTQAQSAAVSHIVGLIESLRRSVAVRFNIPRPLPPHIEEGTAEQVQPSFHWYDGRTQLDDKANSLNLAPSSIRKAAKTSRMWQEKQATSCR